MNEVDAPSVLCVHDLLFSELQLSPMEKESLVMSRSARPPARPLVDSIRGVQPQHGGLLICLYCGQGFKGLAHHIKSKHGITADEYKNEFELPKKGLLAESTLEKRRAHARHLLATDERVQEGILRHDPAIRHQRLVAARAAAAQALQKAGVREIFRENGRYAARVSAQVRRDAREKRAQDLGFKDLADLLVQHVHLSNPELGEMLGCTASSASKIRRTHGAPSQFQPLQRRRAEASRKQTKLRDFEAELAGFGPAVQPLDARGRWQCRTCGQHPGRLAAHLLDAHRISPATYTRRLALRRRLDQKAADRGYRDLADLISKTVMLSNEAVAAMLGYSRRNLSNIQRLFADLTIRSNEQASTLRSVAATYAQQGKRERARHRYNQLAHEHGYPDIETFVNDTMHLTYKHVGATLSIPPHRVQFLRRRYGLGGRN